MTDRPPPSADGTRALRFACSCASAAPVTADPWAAIAKQGKLADGTKELILNALHRRPRTVAQLAKLLDLSPPTVHRHISEMLASELAHEADVSETERKSPVERYYRPNFPVVVAGDGREFGPVLKEVAAAVAAAFRARRGDLGEIFARTTLAADGQPFEAVLHYLYAAATRLARERLEAAGDLPPWPVHDDGSRWIWWAEEPQETEVELTTRARQDGSGVPDEGGG